jgi:hypothetical protein
MERELWIKEGTAYRLNNRHPEAQHPLIVAAGFDPVKRKNTDPKITLHLNNGRTATIILNGEENGPAGFQPKKGTTILPKEQRDMFKAANKWFEPHAEKYPRFAESIRLALKKYEKW